MKLPTLLSGFRRPPAEATAAELRATLADAEVRLTEARAVASKLAEQHGDALLSTESDAAAKHEQAIREAAANITRWRAVISTLGPRIEAAEAGERDAVLKAEADAAEAVADEAAKAVLVYEQAARDLFTSLERINDATKRVAMTNARLVAQGRPEWCVPLPMTRVWAHARKDPLTGVSIPGPRQANHTLVGFEKDVEGLRNAPPVHPRPPEPQRWPGRVMTIERVRR